MLQALIGSRWITPPALWGKLPAHADFVRAGMRHGESEGWQPWLAQHDVLSSAPVGTAPPVAFVLPPGTLAFAPRRFVLGVITPSCDKVGRRHALLVYQVAHARWVARHFAPEESQTNDWLYWLARGIGRHTNPQRACDAAALAQTVRVLWQVHAPTWRTLRRGEAASVESVAQRRIAANAALAQSAGPDQDDDPAAALNGVRHLPWGDWPQRLFRPRAEPAFWQQDADGGFVNASHRLADLWRDTR